MFLAPPALNGIAVNCDPVPFDQEPDRPFLLIRQPALPSHFPCHTKGCPDAGVKIGVGLFFPPPCPYLNRRHAVCAGKEDYLPVDGLLCVFWIAVQRLPLWPVPVCIPTATCQKKHIPLFLIAVQWAGSKKAPRPCTSKPPSATKVRHNGLAASKTEKMYLKYHFKLKPIPAIRPKRSDCMPFWKPKRPSVPM